MNGVYLEVDVTDVVQTADRLRSAMTPENFNKALRRVMRRTAPHIRKNLRKQLPQEYHVKSGEVGSAVKSAKIQSTGTGTGCIIPIVGARKSIGGSFRASGGAHGWASLHRKYRVKGKIVKSNVSVLPAHMTSYGGQPPFRNFSAPNLNGVTFTRAGKDRYPIRKVSGIAIPQMPTNRSKDAIQADIRDFVYKRMEAEVSYILSSGK